MENELKDTLCNILNKINNNESISNEDLKILREYIINIQNDSVDYIKCMEEKYSNNIKMLENQNKLLMEQLSKPSILESKPKTINLKQIDRIELNTTKLDTFTILEEEIEKFVIETHSIYLENTFESISVIKNMLISTNNIDTVISLDTLEKFDIDSSDISQVRVLYKNGDIDTYLVSMTNDMYNRGQMNYIDNGSLYISISDESENFLED